MGMASALMSVTPGSFVANRMLFLPAFTGRGFASRQLKIFHNGIPDFTPQSAIFQTFEMTSLNHRQDYGTGVCAAEPYALHRLFIITLLRVHDVVDVRLWIAVIQR